MTNQDMWQIENSLFSDEVCLICGVDEAGRGPLAGPVCAAAVILPVGLEIPGLNDSKKISDKKDGSCIRLSRKRPLLTVLLSQPTKRSIKSISCRLRILPWNVLWRSLRLNRIWL